MDTLSYWNIPKTQLKILKSCEWKSLLNSNHQGALFIQLGVSVEESLDRVK